MPSFTFTSPEGQKYTVKGPDGATQEQAFAILQSQIGGQKKQTGEAPSMASGLVRSFSRGVPIIGGLLNKADAATDAALAPVMNPLFPEKDQLRGDFSQRYNQAIQTQEGEDAAFSEAHPIVSTGADIAGGVAALGGAALTGLGAKALGLTARTLPGMIAQGTASGAGISALDTAARGGDPTVGAIVGGAAGAAGPIIGKAAGELIAPIARVVRGLRDPLAEAGRRVAGALDRDISSGNAGLSPQEFSAARQAGQPVALMDTGGETTRALMRSAANTSPEARGVIDRFTSDRFSGQGGRLEDWLNTTFNFPNADKTQEALKSGRAHHQSSGLCESLQQRSERRLGRGPRADVSGARRPGRHSQDDGLGEERSREDGIHAAQESLRDQCGRPPHARADRARKAHAAGSPVLGLRQAQSRRCRNARGQGMVARAARSP